MVLGIINNIECCWFLALQIDSLSRKSQTKKSWLIYVTSQASLSDRSACTLWIQCTILQSMLRLSTLIVPIVHSTSNKTILSSIPNLDEPCSVFYHSRKPNWQKPERSSISAEYHHKVS